MPEFSSVQIPKPVDWQPFQRGCVPLFRKLIGDPSLVDFGRGGQDQQGIDLFGYSSGDLARPVGVQCRHVETLKFKAIKKAADQARTITPALTELIFATTSKHDANLQREAMRLTADLVKSGWNCRITIMGWETLQAEIATCPEALQLFWPMASVAPQRRDTAEILTAIQAQGDRVLEAITISKSTPVTAPLDPKLPQEALSERRDVHDRISVFRDLLSDGKPEMAIRGLEQLRASLPDIEPFARYRIETNIGAAHLRAGRVDKALAQWRTALALRPTDPKARANVALGMFATGDADGARELAQALLREHPVQPTALTVLVHASGDALSVDPFPLVPEAAREEPDVLASIIAVLRKRDDKRWYDTAHEAAVKHAEDLRFKQWDAEAKLDPILSDAGLLIGKPMADGAFSTVETAANALLSVWEKVSEDETPDKEAVAALAQNCAAALRFCQRTSEAAAVVDKALMRVGQHPGLVRVRALLYVHEDEDDQAIRIIGDSPRDPELALLRAEILAQDNPAAAAEAIDSTAAIDLPDVVARTAMKLRLELALDLDDLSRATALAGELETRGEPEAALALIKARIEQKRAPVGIAELAEGHDDDATAAPLPAYATALARSLEADNSNVDFLTRVAGAQFLESLDAHEAASNALHGRTDMGRDTVALRTYLSASVSAGLMVRARDALAALPPAVGTLPFYKRINATLLWNTGDARGAAHLVAELRQLYPQRLDILLWHIDCLLRLGEESQVRTLLASINDDQFEGTLSFKLRLARALVAFGQEERALRYSYRLFLTNRDTPEAWMALMSVVLGVPRDDKPDLLCVTADDEDVIEIETESVGKLRYSIEAEEELRRYTTDAIDVTHPIAMAVRGLKPGDTFEHPDGGTAKIVSVKNKYLEAFHTALNRYNDRFPAAGGMRRVQVDFETPRGLDEMKAVLGARSRHVTEQAKEYEKGRMLLGGLALATGVDPVEAMIGLGEVGVAFRVANGFHEEREEAFKAITDNAKRGCIVDGPTFHIIRRLALEGVVAAICGPIGVAQVTLDRLRERLHGLDEHRVQPAGTLAYADGQLQYREISPEAIEATREAVRSDIAWLEANAEVLPAIPKAEPTPTIRRITEIAEAKLFDDIFAASGAERLLVAEDLPTRQLAAGMGVRGTWLQPVLMEAKKRGLITVADYARILCNLSETGEDFISVDGDVLLAAHKLDREAGEPAPGGRLRGVMRCLGGAKADPESHAGAVAGFLMALWADASLAEQRQPATSAVLRRLLRERFGDHRGILAYLAGRFRDQPDLANYLYGWAVGHFLIPREGSNAIERKTA